MTARAFLTARLNVYLADFDGARISRPPGTIVGNTIHANRGPAWSRDGRYLAYYSGVMLMIRDVTTGVDRVVPLPANVHCTPLNPGPKWFPDNRSVLIRVRDPEGSGNGFYRFDAESRRSDLLWASAIPRRDSTSPQMADSSTTRDRARPVRHRQPARDDPGTRRNLHGSGGVT